MLITQFDKNVSINSTLISYFRGCCFRSVSAPVDLSTLQQQLLSGHYESLDAFHSDMLKVFHCAEVSLTLCSCVQSHCMSPLIYMTNLIRNTTAASRQWAVTWSSWGKCTITLIRRPWLRSPASCEKQKTTPTAYIGRGCDQTQRHDGPSRKPDDARRYQRPAVCCTHRCTAQVKLSNVYTTTSTTSQ